MVAVIPTKVAQVINFIIITMNVLYYLFAMCCMLYDIIYMGVCNDYITLCHPLSCITFTYVILLYWRPAPHAQWSLFSDFWLSV